MSYPAAAACYAVPNPIYQPAMRLIESITNANPAVVTTTFAHQYKSGLIVRMDIPPADGMQQIAGQTYSITVLSPTTFSIPVDSTTFQPFSIPSTYIPGIPICALCVPVGEDNGTLRSATQNVLNPFTGSLI